ncbi:hypothetical protein [Streptomyces thermospinosisporus]|uniref:hypothetical protein n=1 Tax=Streptomyces thermospinosisporus TaxID=161482 RepID=UPI0031D4BC4D
MQGDIAGRPHLEQAAQLLLAGQGLRSAASGPPGGQQLGGRGERAVTYLGVPALDGNTWPLRWYGIPTRTAPHVPPEARARVLGVRGQR